MLWNKLTRRLGIAASLFVAVSAFSPLWNYLGAKLSYADEPRHSDAIVVLSSGFFGQGKLDDESVRRSLHGILLYKRGLAPLLVLSGRGLSSQTISEGRLRASLARAMGVPAEVILLEETANTTREESLQIAELLRSKGSSRILLVTESLHMRRATFAFQHTGLQVTAAPSDEYSKVLGSPRQRLWLMTRVLQEVAALTYYRIAGYI